MDEQNSIPQETGATPTDAPVANVDNRTEDQMLADILRTSNESGLFPQEESLPEEQAEVPTPLEGKEADDQETSEVINEEEEQVSPEDEQSRVEMIRLPKLPKLIHLMT